MKVIQVYITKSFQNFNYIVLSEKSKDAIHFDPYDIGQTLSELKSYDAKIKYLLNTHQHWDHVKDNENLIKSTGCELKILSSGQKLYLSDNEFVQALSTPGHVDEHTCYLLCENNNSIGLIAGDTLFNAGVGNCKNGGNVKDLFETTTKIINKLEGHLKIYPSHDYMMTNLEFALSVEPDNQTIKEFIEKRKKGYFVTTLDEERRVNPFLRTENPELQKHFNGKSSEQIFFELRTKRDNW